MRAKRYTHVPILDEANRVIGVFNESAIFDYLVSKTIIEWTDTIVVAEIMDHCRLDAGHTESFHFIRPGTTEDEMVNALVNVEGEFTRVGGSVRHTKRQSERTPAPDDHHLGRDEWGELKRALHSQRPQYTRRSPERPG